MSSKTITVDYTPPSKEQLTIAELEAESEKIQRESAELGARLHYLNDAFIVLANRVTVGDGEDPDDVTDMIADAAFSTLSFTIDYDNSSFVPGYVDIWESSSC